MQAKSDLCSRSRSATITTRGAHRIAGAIHATPTNGFLLGPSRGRTLPSPVGVVLFTRAVSGGAPVRASAFSLAPCRLRYLNRAGRWIGSASTSSRLGLERGARLAQPHPAADPWAGPPRLVDIVDQTGRTRRRTHLDQAAEWHLGATAHNDRPAGPDGMRFAHRRLFLIQSGRCAASYSRCASSAASD